MKPMRASWATLSSSPRRQVEAWRPSVEQPLVAARQPLEGELVASLRGFDEAPS